MWKFKTRTIPLSTTGGGPTYLTSGVSAVIDSGAGARVDTIAVTAIELTGTALEQSKGSGSMIMGAPSLGSVGPDELFANGTKLVDGEGRGNKDHFVHIDVLPC